MSCFYQPSDSKENTILYNSLRGCQGNFIGFVSQFQIAWSGNSSRCWTWLCCFTQPNSSYLLSFILPSPASPFPSPLKFVMKNRSRAIASFGHVYCCSLQLAINKKEEERGKLVNTMLYLNKQSQMASFMPSASDKKRLNRKNKQQLTSHTQNWAQQGEQIPALCTVLSHGSAPNPETCLASKAFSSACFYGASESWKPTGQSIFLFNLIFSLLMKTME